ncbi:hypothetical protein BB561_006105 [Smittium simulii]|uniref:tRNA-5-taurinomethyluridine 2-sulfurtransferase n=1 Tax=Smittium simulii TaxID=133385 RepID=A0A2T9Y6H7_9FUNG|nr:hypothetical protein BB561_006105 [Smittium simulii]
MSGGVDSSVAAYLLKKQGYDITGVYMQNWDSIEEKGHCEGELDWIDVEKVCQHLDIPCIKLNMVKEYWNNVFSNMLEEYGTGYTPNPDIICNQKIKFATMFDKLKQLSGMNTCLDQQKNNIQNDHIFASSKFWFATGHYARLNKTVGNPVMLQRGKDLTKDQSYFLCCAPKQALEKTIFPLGNLTKSTQVRKIAKDAGLPTANKKESMGICFVGKRRHFTQFLREYIPDSPGEIVDSEGKVLGKHQGLFTRTLAQSIGVTLGTNPWFVYNKEYKLNRIMVAEGHDNPLLYSQTFFADSINWITQPGNFVDEEGNLTKSTQVRKIAKDAGLPTANKKESMGICFVGKRRHFTQFLREYIPDSPGEIVDSEGKVLGKHQGLFTRTLAQSIGVTLGTNPWFVYNKEYKLNRIMVAEGHDNPLLYSQTFFADSINWITQPGNFVDEEGSHINLLYQIRHMESPRECTLTKINGEYKFFLKDKHRGVAPGQFVALYQDDFCLGGARITRFIPGG